MTLATRCPNCQTAFRVVRDQLRVSEGWVRCGQCSEVFDANAYLVEWPAVAAYGTGNGPAENGLHASAGIDAADAQSNGQTDARMVGAQAEPRRPSVVDASDPEVSWVISEGGRSVAGGPALPVDDVEQQMQEAYRAAVPSSRSSDDTSLMFPASQDEGDRTTVTGETPQFVKQALTRGSASLSNRMLWWTACMAALLALVGQWVLHERHAVSAKWPLVQPWVTLLCLQVGCRVDAPRAALDDLSVEATTFNRVRGNTYRLSLALRNKSEVPVAAPLIELTLTDQQDQVIARRVLSPGEWAGGVAVMPPREDVNGAVAFSTTLDRVAGYRVLAFYP